MAQSQIESGKDAVNVRQIGASFKSRDLEGPQGVPNQIADEWRTVIGAVLDTIWTWCLCKLLKYRETPKVRIPPSPPETKKPALCGFFGS
jgi:hypothetical protein